MLLDPELTLNKAISMAKANEITKNELQTIEEKNQEGELFKISAQKKSVNPVQKTCWFCGTKHILGETIAQHMVKFALIAMEEIISSLCVRRNLKKLMKLVMKSKNLL